MKCINDLKLLKNAAYESKRMHEDDSIKLKKDQLKKSMKINELKDYAKLSTLEEEISTIGWVKGMKRLEWPIKVVQQIIDLLFHLTKPSAMPHVIELSSKMCSSATVIKELPSVDYLRKHRGRTRTIVTTIASYRLGKNKKWLQLFLILQSEGKFQWHSWV